MISFQVGRDLIEEETAESDRVKLTIYLYYAKAIGIKISVASALFYFFFQVGANLKTANRARISCS